LNSTITLSIERPPDASAGEAASSSERKNAPLRVTPLSPAGSAPSSGQAFPVADQAAASSLAIPIYGELSMAQQQRVVDVIAAFHGQGR